MSDKPELNALVAFAALTGLLAKHPELAEAPVSWSYDRSGITVMLPAKSTSLALFEQVAAAFGGSTHGGHATDRRDGVRTEQYYLDAELAGIRVFGSVGLVVEQDGAE